MRIIALLSLVAVAFCADETTEAPATTTESAAPVTTTEAAVPAATTEAAVPGASSEAPAQDTTTDPAKDAASTEAAVPTQDPKAAEANEIALDVLGGDVRLYRGRNTKTLIHLFTTNTKLLESSRIKKEGHVGFVVSEENFAKLKAKCPDLQKTHIFFGPTGYSYITKDGTPVKGTETFYCSPKADYCGANFPLQIFITGNPVKNAVYPSYKTEAAALVKTRKSNRFLPPQTVCYIWKSVPSTYNDKFTQVRKDVLADNVELYGYVHSRKPIIHKYAINEESIHLLKSSSCEAIGTIANVMSADRQAKATATCPDLVKMQVYQQKGSFPRTFISDTAPEKVEDFIKGGEFYCASKRGYCGADKEIARFESSADYFYPPNEYESSNINTGAAAEFSTKKTPLCWAWTKTEFEDINL